MDKNVKIATVYIEKDGVSCQCVCALHDVGVGDFVQIFLNNAPTIGEVKELQEVEINKLPNSVYDMKMVVRKVPNPNKSASTVKNTIRVSDLIERNRMITFVGRGAVSRCLFTNSEVEAHDAEPGDTIFFSDYDGTRFMCTILRIEDSISTNEPLRHLDAIRKSEKNKAFLKNQIEVVVQENVDDSKVALKKFTLKDEEYTIDDVITHIGTKAFEQARKLKTLVVATNGVTIEPMAFSYNDSIQEIFILDERASINVNCFDGCRKLKRVVLPFNLYHLRYDLVDYYGDKIEFVYVLSQQQHLIDGIVYSKNLKRIICCVDDGIVEFSAPIYVESIAPYAFKNCRHLKKFVASPFMKHTVPHVFDGCMALENVEWYFRNDVDAIVLFGTTYCENANTEQLDYKDGSTRTFYMPKKCKFSLLPNTEDILKTVDPRKADPLICHIIGEYYSENHNVKEAIRFHMLAAQQGYDKSYQKLAAYSEEEHFVEYFSVDQYDYAHRLLTVKPFFNMLALEQPQYNFADVPDEEILDQFMSKEKLSALLQDIANSSIYDTDLLNFGLNKIFLYTEDIHDLDIKRLFLRCIKKIGLFNDCLSWKEELLEEVFVTEADYREFAFLVYSMDSCIEDPAKDAFIEAMPESETKSALLTAHNASMSHSADCIDIFKVFLEKAKETGDVFYQQCAVVSIYSYTAHCWRDKTLTSQFRKTLDLIISKYNEGFTVLGFLILVFKRNMKKSIAKSYYVECAEALYDEGLLYSETFDNILGKNEQRHAAFYCRYPEYFNLDDKNSLIMKAINDSNFYIPGKMVNKPSSDRAPQLYANFLPDMVGGKLVLFINPHEAATYIKKQGGILSEDYFPIRLGNVLSLMQYFDVDEATVFPRVLNRVITREYVESTYDWR